MINRNNSHNCNASSLFVILFPKIRFINAIFTNLYLDDLMRQKMSLKHLKLLLTLAKLKIDFRILNILKVNIAFNMYDKIHSILILLLK
ncbi:hypothetical protein T07_14091 [Trichinella nelsoni]|uniref:Uncharacterized protein n=1 Tax=Trichinella nelsoni TaxID=6336 RepID=A0A0V0SMM5_9BILA|nr:hypothetical protein T07_14091 [Trichinella nelsoni]